MNETNWEIISAISAISVIIGVCLVVRFARSKSSNASVENYHYEKFLERYRSMDDLELDEVFARQLRDKFADSDSVAAIRQVMSERSRGSTPAEKFKSWQEPRVTENNKQHIQAKEEKAAQPEMDDDAPKSGYEISYAFSFALMAIMYALQACFKAEDVMHQVLAGIYFLIGAVLFSGYAVAKNVHLLREDLERRSSDSE